MRFSIGILAQDEDRDLEITVAQAWGSQPRPHEVIVVDDCSTTKVSPRLCSFPSVKCIRHPEPIGVHQGITTFLQNASGDAAIILGGHMRMPLDWLAYFESYLTQYPDAILCPITRGLDVGSKIRGAGATFTRVGRSLSWIGVQWLVRRNDFQCKQVPSLLGACYAGTMESWTRMGGPHRAHRHWGYLESDLSLRAWLCGLECRCVHELVVGHRFGRPKVGKAKVANSHVHTNLLHMVSAFFGEDEFERISRSVAKVFGPTPRRVFDSRRELDLQERRRFQSLQQRPIEELKDLCGFTLPTDDELEHIETTLIAQHKAAKQAKLSKQPTQEIAHANAE